MVGKPRFRKKQRILSEALANRSAVQQADKTCNNERFLEYLPEPTELTGKQKFLKLLSIVKYDCKIMSIN